jgi:hypothetical protein
MVTVFLISVGFNLSVRILIKIILWFIQIQLLIISVRFPKVLIKERLFLYRFRTKVLERQVSSPVDTFSLKSLSNGIYIYKIESEVFSKSGKIIKQ